MTEKERKQILDDAITLATEMGFNGGFNDMFGGLTKEPKPINPYESLNDGFELRPIELSKKELENPRIINSKYSHLYKDGIKVSDNIFRKGGICIGFKDGYCGLIHYVRTNEPKKNDEGFSFVIVLLLILKVKFVYHKVVLITRIILGEMWGPQVITTIIYSPVRRFVIDHHR
jgi:hypothetical protein